MITCIIVDDEQHAIDVLEHYVRQTPSLQLVASFTNPLHALQSLAEKNVDLLFLDIQMPEISGMDLIGTINGRSKIILTTAYSEFATAGFELEVVDYLLKPIPFPRFLKAVQRVQHLLAAEQQLRASEQPFRVPEHQIPAPEQPGREEPAPAVARPVEAAEEDSFNDDYFFVKTELKGKMLKINFREIDYIESMKNYVAIFHNGVKTLALLNMKDLEDRLPARYFMRVHRSFIIAVDKIAAIEGHRIILRNTTAEILLGETYKAPFLEKMKGKMI